MKYVKISSGEMLTDLTEKVGIQNVGQVLADNGLERIPNIGRQFYQKVKEIQTTSANVPAQRKLTILNKFVENSDIYEKAALSDEDEWKVLSAISTFPGYLLVTDQIQESIPNSYFVLGNNESVPASIYSKITEEWLDTQPLNADIFSEISTIADVGLIESTVTNNASNNNPMSWFNLPEGQITLYSSLYGESMNIPAYPEELSDGRVANYTQMPDLLYQYEPWQMYQSSGPRTVTYDFHLHRDMWTGDHTDGKANDLIRFCQAQLYAQYNGASVITSTTTLYVAGSPLISGILTNVQTNWRGPLGLDNWYLEFDLSLTFTEVAQSALSYDVVRNMPLIG